MSTFTPSKFRARMLGAFVLLLSVAMMSCCPPSLLSGKSACSEPKGETSVAKKAATSSPATATTKPNHASQSAKRGEPTR